MKRSAFLFSVVPAVLFSAAPLVAAGLAPAGSASFRPSLAYRSNSVYSVLEAAAAGDVATLEARLAEGESPSEVDERGNTPLHYAVRGESVRALELLLEAGADPAVRNAQGRTPYELCRHASFLRPLQEAEARRQLELKLDALVAAGDAAAVCAALAGGVSPNARAADNNGSVLLHAVSLGHVEVVKVLVAAGADANALTQHGGLSALHLAAARGDVEMIRTLLRAGADPMQQAGNGAYALHDAIWERRLDAVRELLPAYASINFSPRGGPHDTPLNMALTYGRVEVLRAFLEAGFDPNDPRLRDEPPLIVAARNGRVDCVKLLLEAGADRHAPDLRGRMAVDYAPSSLVPLLR